MIETLQHAKENPSNLYVVVTARNNIINYVTSAGSSIKLELSKMNVVYPVLTDNINCANSYLLDVLFILLFLVERPTLRNQAIAEKILCNPNSLSVRGYSFAITRFNLYAEKFYDIDDFCSHVLKGKKLR